MRCRDYSNEPTVVLVVDLNDKAILAAASAIGCQPLPLRKVGAEASSPGHSEPAAL
jgi:hypothetical protein